MKYTVRHLTEIRYDALVNLARFNLRLRPAAWQGQTLLGYGMEVSPKPKTLVEDSGPFVVNAARLTLDRPTAGLIVTSEFSVLVDRDEPSLDAPAPSLASVRNQAFADRGLSAEAPANYLFGSPIAAMTPEIAEWAAPCFAGDRTVYDAALALMQAIHRSFAYDSAATTAETPPIQAFHARRGVCQDFAHIMIIALRHFGVPAAYVSGYLRTLPPSGKPRLVGADATHAWVNVWCGEALGWIGFDPTNAMRVGNDHIFTAMGRDFADVSPLDGVFIGGAGQRMRVSVDVTPITEGFALSNS